MTDRSDLPERLRTLAAHRAKILGKSPEEMEEWQAAEEIAELREALKTISVQRMFDEMTEEEQDDACFSDGYDECIRIARAKLEGGSNDR